MRTGAELRDLQDAIAKEIWFFEPSEAPPLGKQDVSVDQGKLAAGPSLSHSSEDVPAPMAPRPHHHPVLVGAVLAAIVVLLSAAALFVWR
jgi:hypothetical protein